MRADNSHHVVAAARRRAEQTRGRAIAALRRMDTTGQRINFDTVAAAAGVSRSWLYTQDDLRAEIDRLRQPHPAASPAPPPKRQRASDPSLLRRLQAAAGRIQLLRQTISNSAMLSPWHSGSVCAAEVLGRPATRDTPMKNSPKLLGPC